MANLSDTLLVSISFSDKDTGVSIDDKIKAAKKLMEESNNA